MPSASERVKNGCVTLNNQCFGARIQKRFLNELSVDLKLWTDSVAF